MGVGIGRQEHYDSVLEITRLHTQFHFWEYINGNQPFILDSHRPFICSELYIWQIFRKTSAKLRDDFGIYKVLPASTKIFAQGPTVLHGVWSERWTHHHGSD